MAAFAMIAGTCGLVSCNADGATPCEGRTSPAIISEEPPFTIQYGSALVRVVLNFNVSPPIDSGFRQLNIFLSAESSVCGPILGAGTFPRDEPVIWMGIRVPVSGPYVGSFPVTSADGIPSIDSGEEFIVKLNFKSGTHFYDSHVLAPPATAVGTITIDSFVDGVGVTGSFDGVFPDGVPVSGSFSTPFCTWQCATH